MTEEWDLLPDDGHDDDDNCGLSSLPNKFKSYCIFCLRPLGEGCLHNYVRSNPRKIKSFRQILTYLTGKEHRLRQGSGESSGDGVPLSEVRLPPMCQPCYEIVADIYHLHKDLIRIQHLIQKKTLIVRMTVLKTTFKSGSKGSIPREKFEGGVGNESGLSKKGAGNVKAVVDKLHHTIIGEGTRSVKIPQVLPVHLMNSPNSIALANKRQTSLSGIYQQEVKIEETGTWGETSMPSYGDPDWYDEEMEGEANCEEVPFDTEDCSFEVDEDAAHPDTDKKPKLSLKISKSPISAKLSTSKSLFKKSTHPNSLSRSKEKGRINQSSVGFVNANNNSQICDLCGKSFPVSDIVQHLESHVKDYVSKCPNPDCHFAFSSHTRMDKHLLNSKKCRTAVNIPLDARNRVKQCDNCGFQTNSTTALRNHLETHEHEMTEKNFNCPIQGCEERYSLRQNVDIHLNTHNLRQAKVFQSCPTCSAKLHVNSVSTHLADVHGVLDADILPCSKCRFIFTDKAGLVKHLKAHGQESWICDVCDDKPKFLRHFNLVKHYFDLHQVGHQYPCELCDKVFYLKTTMQDHRRVDHSGKKAKTTNRIELKCDICFYTSPSFKSQADVYVHKIQAHGAERFPCDVCKQKFTRKSFLIRHKRTKHEGFNFEARHKCDVEGCGMVAYNRNQLEDHKYAKHSVSGERRHICDICGKGYNWTDGLRKHKQTVHARLRAVCEICGESFRDMQILRDHKLIHTGERPHSCPICNQPFRQRSAMRNHIKSHKRWGESFKTTGPRENVARRVFKKKKE